MKTNQPTIKIDWHEETLYIYDIFGYKMRQHQFDPIEVYVEGTRGSGWDYLKDTYIVCPSEYFYVRSLFKKAWKKVEEDIR